MLNRASPIFLLALVSCLPVFALDKTFSWTMAPGSGDAIGVDLAPFQLSRYLGECEVNRPEIVNEVKERLDKGEYYRERTRDQRNRATTLTVYVDSDLVLHIVTWRREKCPECGGTGTRAQPFKQMTGRVGLRFKCLKCDGEGEIPNYVNERYFTLSSEDFSDPRIGRAVFARRAYANAPSGAEQWVERLASADPRERLAACEWLDQNYVKRGAFFQDIMPMLRKARFHEANEKRKMLVWQFWAGKDLPDERRRAYYRIYADSRDGKIVRKEFVSGR